MNADLKSIRARTNRGAEARQSRVVPHACGHGRLLVAYDGLKAELTQVTNDYHRVHQAYVTRNILRRFH